MRLAIYPVHFWIIFVHFYSQGEAFVVTAPNTFVPRTGAPQWIAADRYLESNNMKSVARRKSRCRRRDLITYLSMEDNDDDLDMMRHTGDSEQMTCGPSPSQNAYLEELQYRIARQKILGPGLDPNERPPEEVHVILFDPESDNESVHIIQFPEQTRDNIILAFECAHECNHFASLLKNEHSLEPSREKLDFASLEEYCRTLEVHVQVVPRGTHLIPPGCIVQKMDEKSDFKETLESLDRLFQMQEDNGIQTVQGGSLIGKEYGGWQ